MKNNHEETRKKTFYLDGASLSTEDIFHIVKDELHLAVRKKNYSRIKDSSDLLEQLIQNKRIIYGVNTSFGGLVHRLVPEKYARVLQENLLSAVATNVGLYFEDRIVKASIIARINSLSRGTSAISVENFNKLLKIYNSGIIPCVPSKGSLGASGDLGPLACIGLVGIGKWKAKYQDKIVSGKTALRKAGIEPMRLSFKEGLSLINGTSMMAGLASLLIEEAIILVKTYDIISSLSLEGLRAKKNAFNPAVHYQKQHLGQLKTAQNIWEILIDSQMVEEESNIENLIKSKKINKLTFSEHSIEDPYSIRCTPQIVGPIRDNLKNIKDTICRELNSSSDNPLIIPGDENAYHNGHFHGQYISMAMDQLCISLVTLSNLSDRRIDRFMDKNNNNNLPPFLCAEQLGLRLGLMGGQFMSTSLTAENRSLCHPVSIQTLTSTGDFQDVVSMGLIAARRAKEILENTSHILACELICAVQAAEIRNKELLSKSTRCAFECVREVVPYISKGEPLTDYIESLAILIQNGKLLKKVEDIKGEIKL